MDAVKMDAAKKTIAINKRGMKHNKTIADIVVFTVLSIGAVVMMYPLIWMLFTALKPYTEVYLNFFPKTWLFSNFIDIWKEVNLVRGFFNSILTTVPVVIVQVFVSAMAAFAFAKLNFKGKNALFLIMLGTMMIPFTVIMIPQVVVFRFFGLFRGSLAVIIPKMFGSVMTVFFLRQFLYGIPDSLTEAAKLDGAGYLYLFIKIILPLIMPALATQIILSFIGNWNDFLGPLLYINGREWYTLPLMINEYSSGNGSPEYIPRLMAASLVSMVPVIVIFAVFQKKIIGSIVFSAVKG